MYVYAVERFAKPLTQKRALEAIQAAASKFGLHKVLEQHKPSRSHWHLKRGTSSGTLEVTWERAENRVRVIVHKNRVGANGWARELAPTFAETLASLLEGSVTPHHVTNGD